MKSGKSCFSSKVPLFRQCKNTRTFRNGCSSDQVVKSLELSTQLSTSMRPIHDDDQFLGRFLLDFSTPLHNPAVFFIIAYRPRIHLISLHQCMYGTSLSM